MNNIKTLSIIIMVILIFGMMVANNVISLYFDHKAGRYTKYYTVVSFGFNTGQPGYVVILKDQYNIYSYIYPITENMLNDVLNDIEGE